MSGFKFWAKQEMRELKAFREAGARILAGTDASNPYTLVGFGMIDELELYVKAGLSAFVSPRPSRTGTQPIER
jgi:hypothetical protein